jgi:hypothetical protein
VAKADPEVQLGINLGVVRTPGMAERKSIDKHVVYTCVSMRPHAHVDGNKMGSSAPTTEPTFPTPGCGTTDGLIPGTMHRHIAHRMLRLERKKITGASKLFVDERAVARRFNTTSQLSTKQ